VSGGFQLAVALSVNFDLSACKHIVGRDVAGGTVQADIVVMLHVALDQTLCIFQRQRRSRPNALAFQGLVPALNLAVRLWIVRGGSDVRYARDANELLEVASDEQWPVVGDASWLRFRVLLLGSLQDQFDISFSAGGPLKPDSGLSGAFLHAHKIFFPVCFLPPTFRKSRKVGQPSP